MTLMNKSLAELYSIAEDSLLTQTIMSLITANWQSVSLHLIALIDLSNSQILSLNEIYGEVKFTM